MADVARFEVHLDGGSEEGLVVTGELVDGDWQTSPESMRGGLASRLVSELSTLQATDFAAESAGEEELAGLGFAPPRARVLVFGQGEGADAPVLAELHFGVLRSLRGLAARIPERATVFWVDGALAEHVPLSVAEFRERFASGEDEAASAGPEAEAGADD